MSKPSRPPFRYSANVWDAVEVLLPGNKGALRDLEAGISITRRLAPIVHMKRPSARLIAKISPPLPPEVQKRMLRRDLASLTIGVACWERAGLHSLPKRTYPVMETAVEALRRLNSHPASPHGGTVEQRL